MVRYVTLLLLCLALFEVSAQELAFESKWWGSYWTLDGEPVKKRDFRDQLKARPEAYREYKKWEEANGVGSLLRSVGGVMVIVGGIDKNWTIIGVSLGAFVGGMALISVADKKASKTVELFNNAEPIRQTDLQGFQLELMITEQSIGLAIRF